MTDEAEHFVGFGPDTVAFLAGIDADNTKTYFDVNREVYDDQVRRPLQKLCLAVGDRLAAGPVPEIRYEPKVGRSMFRINRDLRFGKDKTPYHPHLDLAWWHGENPKTSPAFFMRIRHDELLTGVGVFALADDRLDRYRSAVVGEPGVEPTPASITTAASVDHVADRLGAYADLHRWLVSHAGRPRTADSPAQRGRTGR